MLDLAAGVAHVDIRKGIRAALVTNQHGVALRIIARAGGCRRNTHQPAIAVVGVARRNAFADDGAAGVFTEVDHLGAGVGLLIVIGQRHRIKLAHRVVAAQHARRVLPGNRRTGFDLRPRNARVHTLAQAALGDKVVDAAHAFFVARVPVLHGRIFDVGVVHRHQLHHRRVQLIGIKLGRGAAFEIRHRGAVFGHDQRALELAGILRVDPKIRGQLHRAFHALGDVAKRAVGEHRGIQRRVKVVAHRHHRAHVFAHQIGMVTYGFRDGAEDNAHVSELLFVGGSHRYRIENHVHRHARECGAFIHRHAEFFKGAQQFGIDLIHAGEFFLRLRRGVVTDVLKIDFRIMHIGPRRRRHGQPVAIGLETKFQQPLRLVFLRRNKPDGVFAQALGRSIGFDIGDEAVLVGLIDQFLNRCAAHIKP